MEMQADLEMRRRLEAQPKKTLNIIGGAESVVVNINGCNYRVEGGTDVDVPESVAEVLMRSAHLRVREA